MVRVCVPLFVFDMGGGILGNFDHFPLLSKCPNFFKLIRTNEMREVCEIHLTAVRGRKLCCVSENEGFHFLEIWVHFGPDEITWPLSHHEPPGLNRRFEPADLAVHYGRCIQCVAPTLSE